MSIKEMSVTDATQTRQAIETPASKAKPGLNSPELDASRLQAERRELARDFVTLKHTISQLRAERDRLAVENRDMQIRLATVETDYANLFSYVEGTQNPS